MLLWKRASIRSLHFDFYTIAAIIVIALAAILRVTLVALGWPPLDSDEGTMGLMGMHIAFHREWPIFFYGQGYMGAFEAYVAAIMFRLFGVSTFTLLLGLIFMYALFLIVIYRLTCLLYSRSLALITLVLLCLGSNPMLTRELIAIGGYPETLLFGSILMLLSCWLVLGSHVDASASESHRRLWVYSAWGFVAGLGIWTHVLVAPFVLMGGTLLLLFCWRELLGWPIICLLVTLIIGALPMIIYNVYAAPGQSTLSYILNVHSGSGITLPPRHILYLLQIKGALLVSLPLATGVAPLCSPSAISFGHVGSVHHAACTFIYTAWSLGVMALWVLACVLALRSLAYAWLNRKNPNVDQSLLKLSVARLALLATSALTLFLYIISPDSALFPVATSRYLIGVLISTPAILWPLWDGADIVKPLFLKLSSRHKFALRLEHGSVVVRYIVLIGIGLILFLGTQSIFTGIPAAPPVEQRWGRFATQVNDQHLDLAATRALNRQQFDLIDKLLGIRAVHIYSDYWTCNRLIFQSRERIICVSLRDNLLTGQNRYLPYVRIVRADTHAAYVFPIGSPQAALFAQHTRRSYNRYKHYTFDDYIVYQPRR